MTKPIEWLTAAKLARPAVEEIGWLGSGAGNYSDIDWRDPIITKPTAEECQAAWDAWVVQEEAKEEAAAVLNTNAAAVISDFGASVLAGKTPAQIAAYFANEINAWASLADAKTDLLNWLPKMAAAIAWVVIEKEKAT